VERFPQSPRFLDPAPTATFFQFGNYPAISGGRVAFEADFTIGGSQHGIFSGTGGALTTIAKTGDTAPSGTFTTFGSFGPSISDTTVAFEANYGVSSLVSLPVMVAR